MRSPSLFRRSIEHVGDDVSVHIGQSSLDAVVVEAESTVIESSDVKDGGMEVVNAGGLLDRLVSKRVGRPIGERRLDSSTGHPCGEAIGVVIASTGSFLECGHAAEFAAEDDECILE